MHIQAIHVGNTFFNIFPIWEKEFVLWLLSRKPFCRKLTDKATRLGRGHEERTESGMPAR